MDDPIVSVEVDVDSIFSSPPPFLVHTGRRRWNRLTLIHPFLNIFPFQLLHFLERPPAFSFWKADGIRRRDKPSRMFPDLGPVVPGRTTEYCNNLGLRHPLVEKFEFLFSKSWLLDPKQDIAKNHHNTSHDHCRQGCGPMSSEPLKSHRIPFHQAPD